MTDMRYAIIGTGMMGQEHIRNIQLLDGARIVGLADPDQGMLDMAKAVVNAPVAATQQYRDMINNPDIDAFVIASPNDTHFDILGHLMKAEKPILCEKPLCTTVAQVHKLKHLTKRYPAPIWVAMEYRYMLPVAHLLKQNYDQTIGTPRMLTIREHRYPFLDKVDNWNRTNQRTGGTFVEKCCHFWDLMRLILGSDPVRVFTSAGQDVNHRDARDDIPATDVIDNAFVILDFADGCRAMLDLCMFAEGGTWQEIITLTGNKGQMASYIPPPLRFTSSKDLRPGLFTLKQRHWDKEQEQTLAVDPSLLKVGDHFGATFYQHQGFLNMLRSEQRVPEVTVDDGLWSVLIGAAAEESAREKRIVHLDPL